MAIIKFKRESEGVSVEINDVVTYISRSATIRTEPPSNFRIFADGQNLFLTLTDNTFFIDDIEQTDPTLSEITNVLRTSVFSDFPYKSHTAAELKAIKEANWFQEHSIKSRTGVIADCFFMQYSPTN